jgi:predicted transposase/invertase (TIGR01784 family)
VRIYLNELPPVPPDQFEMGILELIAAKPEIAFEKARVMVPRLRQSKLPKVDQRQVLQLIETVIVHQFPKWSREEIAKMLQVTDVTQTRVYQEGVEDGIEKGIEKGIETVALRLLKIGRPVAEIAQATGLTSAQIRKLSRKSKK